MRIRVSLRHKIKLEKMIRNGNVCMEYLEALVSCAVSEAIPGAASAQLMKSTQQLRSTSRQVSNKEGKSAAESTSLISIDRRDSPSDRRE